MLQLHILATRARIQASQYSLPSASAPIRSFASRVIIPSGVKYSPTHYHPSHEYLLSSPPAGTLKRWTGLLPDPAKDRSGRLPTTCIGIPNALRKRLCSIPSFPQWTPEVFPPKNFLGSVPGAGMGTFAAKDLARGETIWKERPLLLAPREQDVTFHEYIHALSNVMPPDARKQLFGLYNSVPELQVDAVEIFPLNSLPSIQHTIGVIGTNRVRMNVLPL
ncbi:hypothetical protein B0H10DRAFT_1397396 [Mycena sp. CBHHK59/15]|nr:hypothetical protein B0H10DRAFT_1397396 [Mycena sp. CBHHK59/15]